MKLSWTRQKNKVHGIYSRLESVWGKRRHPCSSPVPERSRESTRGCRECCTDRWSLCKIFAHPSCCPCYLYNYSNIYYNLKKDLKRLNYSHNCYFTQFDVETIKLATDCHGQSGEMETVTQNRENSHYFPAFRAIDPRLQTLYNTQQFSVKKGKILSMKKYLSYSLLYASDVVFQFPAG